MIFSALLQMRWVHMRKWIHKTNESVQTFASQKRENFGRKNFGRGSMHSFFVHYVWKVFILSKRDVFAIIVKTHFAPHMDFCIGVILKYTTEYYMTLHVFLSCINALHLHNKLQAGLGLILFEICSKYLKRSWQMGYKTTKMMKNRNVK